MSLPVDLCTSRVALTVSPDSTRPVGLLVLWISYLRYSELLLAVLRSRPLLELDG